MWLVALLFQRSPSLTFFPLILFLLIWHCFSSASEGEELSPLVIKDLYMKGDMETLTAWSKSADPYSEAGEFLAALMEEEKEKGMWRWERFLANYPNSPLEPIALERLVKYYSFINDTSRAAQFERLLHLRHPDYRGFTFPPSPPPSPSSPVLAEDKPNLPVWWTVQVGAFRQLAMAQQFGKTLTPYGTIYYLPESGGGERLIKVCVGKFSSREEAETLLKTLEKEKSIQGWVRTFKP